MTGAKTALVDDVTELLILLPHLRPALARDEGVSEAPERVSGGPVAFALPINADVSAALATLDTEVPALASWAARVVAEPPQARNVGGHLQHFPRWHERMLVTAAADNAAHLAACVHSILRQVKLALGLRTPDRRLGQYCPMHDAPLCELITPGGEGHIQRLPSGAVIVTWDRQPPVARCVVCRASWVGDQQLLLGRLMREADARRLDAAAEAAS